MDFESGHNFLGKIVTKLCCLLLHNFNLSLLRCTYINLFLGGVWDKLVYDCECKFFMMNGCQAHLFSLLRGKNWEERKKASSIEH